MQSWVRRRALRACQLPAAHYSDDRARKTGRAIWRVYEADLREFLTQMRQGKSVPLPDSIWRK